MDEVLHLTLAGGKRLRIRKSAVIAAHAAEPSETHSAGKTKIYLSSGRDMFVKEDPEQCVRD